MSNEDILQIINAAKEFFCNGIYVPCEFHPCGWDYINFENVDELNYEEYTFEDEDISNSVYCNHPYCDLTLKDILEETNGKYAFELSGIDW